jgi:2,4-dienoyl-CoA reductase-like NADH-dependent reductase (Old Yellow Enzyme family)
MGNRENSIIFKSGMIGNLKLKNRLIRSATFENGASFDGEVTDFMIDLYGKLAEGGVGLIITGITGVYPKALTPHQLHIHDDSRIAGLKKLADRIHEAENDCKIMVQLNHPGRQIPDPENREAFLKYLPPAFITAMMNSMPAQETEEEQHPLIEPTAPSSIYDELLQRYPRALSLEEIDEIINTFAAGIRRVREAGFDGVQLHAAHGWLLSSFLSPHTNHREDQYGGSTENRVRIVTAIYDRARKMVGSDFPILIKMNTTDFLKDGIDLPEAVKIAEILAEIGFAALEVSGGMWEAVTRGQEELGWPAVILPESRVNIKTPEQEAYFLPNASEIKKNLDVPIILVGGLRSFSKIEEIVEAGHADFISMSRPFVRQPDLPNLWLKNEHTEKAECISCNACLPLRTEPIRCRAKKE